MILFWGGIAVLLTCALAFVLIPLFVSYQKTTRLASVIFVFIACFAFILYFHVGASEQLPILFAARERAVAVEKMKAELGNPTAVIAKLKSHLQQTPQSAQGWYLLGRLYLTTNQPKNAVGAFAKAHHIEPSNLNYQLQYIEALLLDQKMTAAEAMLKMVLKESPNNIQANNLLAFSAYQRHNYRQAISIWEKILRSDALNNEDREAVEKAISQAQSALNHKG